MGPTLLRVIANSVLHLLSIQTEQLAGQNLGIVPVCGDDDLGLDVAQRPDHPPIRLAQRLVSYSPEQAELLALRQHLTLCVSERAIDSLAFW